MRERARIVASIHDDDDGSDLDEGAHHTGTQESLKRSPLLKDSSPASVIRPLKGLEGANIINQGLI